jgi:hypothetical protein
MNIMKPKGKLYIEVIDKTSGEIEKVVEANNLVTSYGVEALGFLMMEADANKKIDKLVYGDKGVLGEFDIHIEELHRERGQVPLTSYVIQGIVEQTMTMLYKITDEGITTPIVINELGLKTVENKLFAYVHLLPAEVLILEPGKQINIYWKYHWV